VILAEKRLPSPQVRSKLPNCSSPVSSEPPRPSVPMDRRQSSLCQSREGSHQFGGGARTLAWICLDRAGREWPGGFPRPRIPGIPGKKPHHAQQFLFRQAGARRLEKPARRHLLVSRSPPAPSVRCGPGRFGSQHQNVELISIAEFVPILLTACTAILGSEHVGQIVLVRRACMCEKRTSVTISRRRYPSGERITRCASGRVNRAIMAHTPARFSAMKRMCPGAKIAERCMRTCIPAASSAVRYCSDERIKAGGRVSDFEISLSKRR